MVWWQGLIIVLGSIALGILAGVVAGRLAFRMWPWLFSRKRKTPVSNNWPIELDTLVKDSRNKYREDVHTITVPAKSEGQALSLAHENKHPITEQETNLQAERLPQEKIRPVASKKVVREATQAEEQATITAGAGRKAKESVAKSQMEAERVTWEKTGQEAQPAQTQNREAREAKLAQEAVDQARREASRAAKEKALQVLKEREEQSKQEATTRAREKAQREAEQAESARKVQEARAKLQTEIERLTREEAGRVAGEGAKKAEQEAEAVRNIQEAVTQDVSRQTPGLVEIQTNLRIATTPGDDKPLPFQTKIWDTNKSEFDSLGVQHRSELGQAYVDMAMANHIVWLWTEIGYTSNDLKANYKLLCTKIAERLAPLLG